MNDIIKPFDFDLTKKLHGHVRVETRSRWTGRVVDSQEKENLVTNAVQQMIQTTAWLNSSIRNAWSPIYERLLGGIFLFDNTLTEQASNIGFPSSTKLVAYAGQSSNLTEAIGGSYNPQESVKTSNGFTTVWDFGTSQANGTIASLARTSWAFNWSPVADSFTNYRFQANDADGTSSLSAVCLLGYDDTNKYLYLGSSGVTFNGVTYPSANIYRVKYDFSKFYMNITLPLPTEWELFKTLTSSDGTTNSYYFRYDKHENNLVYKSSTTLHIIDSTGTHSTKTMSGVYNEPYCFTENYYWAAYNNNIYRFDKSNMANVQTIALAGVSHVFPLENDVVVAYLSARDNSYIVYPDDTIITKLQTGKSITLSSTISNKVSQLYAQNTTSTFTTQYANSHYLGTIANLDSPVTKTSSQTMKITYTLTEA